MAKDDDSPYLVTPGKPSRLSERDTDDLSEVPNKDKAEEQLHDDAVEIGRLQERLYAEGRRALLLVLQGTDTSGKDGTIRHVFYHTSPLGVSVTSFGKPTEAELARDYLWRVHHVCPRFGTIGIFNRSHYEDVLIGRVEELAPHKAIEQRYAQINEFERMLTENGTTILKIMLHISKKAQRARLQARLDRPHKRWKFNPADLEGRDRWDEYAAAYELMLDRCSTEWAPWYVVPSDTKWARNAIVGSMVRRVLEEMDPQPHQPDWDPKDFKIN